MRILIFTYREINWILYCYARMHMKHWGEKFTIIAEQEYINSDEDFNGCYDFIKPPFENNEIEGGDYNEVLRWTLDERIDDDFVTIMCADYLIDKPVKKDIIEQTIEYMKLNPTVLRAQLGNHSGVNQRATKTDEYKDIIIKEHNFLPTSLTPGIWNRKNLLELMKNMNGSHTAWDVEIKGRDAFPSSGFRSIGVDPESISYINALRGRNNNHIVISQDVYNATRDLIPDHVNLPNEVSR